jgi:hypothetical protein
MKTADERQRMPTSRCLSHTSLLRVVLVFLVFLSFPAFASSSTVQIGSPWAASTINKAIVDARDGDVILLVGRGTATWTEVVSIPPTKGITLMVEQGTNGSWNENRDGRVGSSFPIVVSSNQSIVISVLCGANNSLTRISGFKFGGHSPLAVVAVSGHGLGRSDTGAYRIDNNYFDHNSSSAVIALDGGNGELDGLVDNNTFNNPYYDNYTIRVRETWKGSSSSCYGYNSWIRDFTFGTSRFHFIEDNLFKNTTEYQRHSVSSDGAGGRYVVRYNTFITSVPAHTLTPHGVAIATDFIDAHGDGTQGLGAGARGGEVYRNTFSGVSSGVHQNIGLRGGQWLVYDNTFSSLGHATSPIHLTDIRASSIDCWQVQYPSLCWQGEPQCATTKAFDSLYPLPGQIRDTYFWNNTFQGRSYAPVIDAARDVPVFLVNNRDFRVSDDVLDAQNHGLSANYHPYTYPHPLRDPQSSLSSNDSKANSK